MRFNLSGPGIHVIEVDTPLVLTDAIVIDGMTQPSYAGTPRVVVQGVGSVETIFVLETGTISSTVQGLGITGFASAGISILPGSDRELDSA